MMLDAIRCNGWRRAPGWLVSAWVLLLAALSAGCGRAPVTVTLSGALADLTNVAVFAEAPAGHPGRLTGAFEALVPDADGWRTVADLRGPGSLQRLWTDGAPVGRWRFYFDHEPDPRLDLDTGDLFGEGGRDPFLPPLAEAVSGGRVSYVPMPYAEALRIEVAGVAGGGVGTNAAFAVHYLAYDAERMRVRSFPAALDPAERQAAAATRAVWLDTAGALRSAAAACTAERVLMLEPGGTVVWLDERGPATLRAFRLRLLFPSDTGVTARVRTLRSLVLRFYWDDAERPSVDVPLGDFFVNAWRSRRFASLPLGRVDDEYVCRFPMYFQRAARAELRHDGTIPLTVHAAAAIEAGRGVRERRNYFHAGWQSQQGSNPVFRAMQAMGPGHGVGLALTAASLDASGSVFGGVDAWTIAGFPEPLDRGTGLAAAFDGGGWYDGLFDRPLAGLVETAPMRAQQYRWWLADRIPFSRDLAYDWHFEALAGASWDVAAVSYGYHPKPVSVPGLPPVSRRQPASDPLDQQAIMCALFELERIGHIDEARDRAIEYYERHTGTLITDFIRIRILGYEALLQGVDALRPVYAEIMARVKGTLVGRELERLLWFYDGVDRGLLATHINGRFRVYLNGDRIEQGDNPTTLVARPVVVRPGTNELAVKVIPNKPGAWLSLFLRTHATNIVSGTDWEYARRRPADWPATTDPEVEWLPVGGADQLPVPRWWRVHPNIFVGMQSGRQLVWPWRGVGWSEPPYEETVFRKRFVLPESVAVPEASEVPARKVMPEPGMGEADATAL